VEVPSATLDLFEGKASCAKIALRDAVFAEDLKTRFSYTRERLALSDLDTRIAGGDVTGGLVIKTSESHSPFTTDVKFDAIDLNRLISEAGGPSNQATGKISGFVSLYGLLNDVDSIAGSGQIALTNGHINQLEMFQMLGKILQIEELSQLNLQQARAAWRIEKGTIWIDQLMLRSENLQLTAQGPIDLDGPVNLDARLAINQKISRQLPEFVATNFKPLENSDLYYVDFKIFGTLSKPRTDLAVRVLGREIEKKVEKKAVDLLRSILGGSKKQGGNHPAPPAPAPSPAP
jgi:hypothetical protein